LNISPTNIISKGSLSIEQIVAVIRGVLEELNVPRTLHQPLFQGHEWEYLKDCIDTGWVSSVGSYVDRFERDLAEFTGAKRAVTVVNGTAALQIALKLAGVESGDEVLTPALTFVATANAVMYCGATPHFVDSEFRSLGLDSRKLADYLKDIAELTADGCRNRITSRRIRAVVPMHTFGHPVDMDPLVELCARWKIEIIEDAAEGLGSYYKGRHTGTIGHIGILSFNGNKIMTTGGGGALLFNDESEARMAKHITTTARLPHPWTYFHDQLGYNFRMPNLNAALGCAQLEQMPAFLSLKRNLAARYIEAFRDVPGIKFAVEPMFARSNYWLNALLLDEECADQRDSLLEQTNQQGIMTRPVWVLMQQLPMYKNCPRMDLEVAESLERRIVNIPSSAAPNAAAGEQRV
jgi:perosamine synthetase